jgi:hypothetical protein
VAEHEDRAALPRVELLGELAVHAHARADLVERGGEQLEPFDGGVAGVAVAALLDTSELVLAQLGKAAAQILARDRAPRAQHAVAHKEREIGDPIQRRERQPREREDQRTRDSIGEPPALTDLRLG